MQGESKTLIRLALQKPEISAGSMGHWLTDWSLRFTDLTNSAESSFEFLMWNFMNFQFSFLCKKKYFSTSTLSPLCSCFPNSRYILGMKNLCVEKRFILLFEVDFFFQNRVKTDSSTNFYKFFFSNQKKVTSDWTFFFLLHEKAVRGFWLGVSFFSHLKKIIRALWLVEQGKWTGFDLVNLVMYMINIYIGQWFLWEILKLFSF